MNPRFRMRGEDVLLLHWPIKPSRIRPHIPSALEIDTQNGNAWVGILAFRVIESHPEGVPVPTFRPFPQLNFRTYVQYNGDSGVYFISSDTPNKLGIEFGRRYLRLPMYQSRIEMRNQAHSRIFFRSRRTQRDAPPARFTVQYQSIGESFTAAADSLDSFLIENNLYFIPEDDRVHIGEIDRDEWHLTEADFSIKANTLFETLGIPLPEQEPIAHYSPGFEMITNRPQ